MTSRALALLLLVAAALFSPHADAANVTQCLNSTTSSRAAAVSTCSAWASGSSGDCGSANDNFQPGTCAGGGTASDPIITATNHWTASTGAWSGVITVHYPAVTCPAGTVFDPSTGSCSNPCSASAPALGPTTLAVPPGTPVNPWLNQPTDACSGGCAYRTPDSIDPSVATRFTIDGQKYVTYSSMNPTGQTCVAGSGDGSVAPTTPPTDSDGDGTSDGKDGNPNNPGDNGANPPPTPPPAGTCGGDGQPKCPDNTDPNNHQSSGGGDCSTPPQSSGDPILAQIAFQTWATRCAIQGKANQSGGGTAPAGTGTDMTATNGKLDALGTKLDGIKGDLDGLGSSDGSNLGDPSTGVADGSSVQSTQTHGQDGLDTSGFGFSRSCPTPPSFDFQGRHYVFSTDKLCDWVAVGGWFVLLITAWRCMQMISGA